MTSASAERCANLSEVSQHREKLQRDLEHMAQELNKRELEKQDAQKQLDTLQSSCDYFQKKYKSTANELKNLKNQDQDSEPRTTLAALQRERDEARNQVATLQQMLHGG